MPVIDTSYLIDLDEDIPAAAAAWTTLRRSRRLLPPSAAAEYLTKESDPAAGLAVLHQSFDIPDGGDAWILACAALRQETRAAGRRVRVPDVWIAAWARMLKTYVVTADAGHFAALGVAVWDYRNQGEPPV